MFDIVQSALQKAQYHLGADVAQMFKVAVDEYAAVLLSLKDAIDTGNKAAERALRFKILHSRTAKLTCVLRSLKKGDDLSGKQICSLARQISPFQDCGELISAYEKPKSNGKGTRTIVKFGVKRRALQRLVADILEIKFPKSKCDYLANKRGPDIMAAEAVKALEAENNWGFIFDIQNFYRSVQRKEIEKTLGLPKDVINTVVFIAPDAPLSLSSPTPSHLFEGTVREGLPQGSVVSGFVAGLLLGPVLEQFAPADHAFLYGDDAMVLASNKATIIKIAHDLPTGLLNHPHGPFLLKYNMVVHIDDGFDFVKYNMRRDAFTGEITLRPSKSSYERFLTKLGTEALAVGNIDFIGAPIKVWVDAFPLWTWGEHSIEHLIMAADSKAWEMASKEAYTKWLASKKTPV